MGVGQMEGTKITSTFGEIHKGLLPVSLWMCAQKPTSQACSHDNQVIGLFPRKSELPGLLPLAVLWG